MPTWSALVYGIVRRIPRGRVATYGQIAALLGAPWRSREVGWALHACGDDAVPCHRVVDRNGRLAPDFHSQRARLADENVRFAGSLVDLERHRWRPRVVTRSRGGLPAGATSGSPAGSRTVAELRKVRERPGHAKLQPRLAKR